MGFTPEHSVVDADHRAWGVDNLFVCDGSVMPTQGAANPALTIMALASRLAQRLVDKRVSRKRRRARLWPGRPVR
jgi:choline dehydrogenase-like flavoprotein